MYHHPDEDFFRKLNVDLPKTSAHGTEEDIRGNLKRLDTRDWKLKGNQLTCMTEMGELSQTIPTNKILVGTDKNGMPILQTIAL